MKLYTEEELVNLGIQDRVNYENAVRHLNMDWNMPTETLTAVSVYFGGSYDIATEYLEDMDSEGTVDPSDIWEDWKRKVDIDDPNPFI